MNISRLVNCFSKPSVNLNKQQSIHLNGQVLIRLVCLILSSNKIYRFITKFFKSSDDTIFNNEISIPLK